MSAGARELIVVRSLTDSDLGIFAAHRAAARSKQRAININAPIARRMLSAQAFEQGGVTLDCYCSYRGTGDHAQRYFGKVGKNWRFGGNKIEGEPFGSLDSKDFVLIRTVAGNDGSQPVHVSFVGRAHDRVAHAGIAAIVQSSLEQSMVAYDEGTENFGALVRFVSAGGEPQKGGGPPPLRPSRPVMGTPRTAIPPIPREETPREPGKRTVRDKFRSPHILELMLKAAGDLSAPAQHRFMDTVEQLATQLREVLVGAGRIVSIPKNHRATWNMVAGREIGFIDGGLANLSMLGSVPIAARVGGYVVRPGDYGPQRESFTMLKHLIDELYAPPDGGVYNDSFPDIGALRDAARISIEAAGVVRVLADYPEIAWVFLHGALVNPVSRYTDLIQDGKVRHAFPNFSPSALREFLPPAEPNRRGRDANFVSVHLRQLEIMAASSAVVCGVIERPATTSSVCLAVLNSLDDQLIRDMLPLPLGEWRKWFMQSINPADSEDVEGQRITDSLLFRCVLEPGEALRPVTIDRNEMRRAPKAWADVIVNYPKPLVSYIQPTEWNAPIRVEIFEKDACRFAETATLVMHSALLLPQYAFPAGLDIVDKFARIPDWMSRPINTHTAVQAMKRALDSGDTRVFDTLRRMLCGSQREWLLRPGIMK